MAKTKTRGEGSNAIRGYFSKHPDATAQQVVDGLKAEGVTVTATLVYNVKSYDARKAGKKGRKAGRKMAKAAAPAASTNGVTKADSIRAVAGGMEKPVRPRDVVAALKEQGIDVNRTQVGQVLAKMGMRRKRRRRKTTAGTAARTVASNSGSLNIDDLIAAKKLVAHVGSIEKVKEALSALARLS